MKKNNRCTLFIVISLIFMVLLSGCDSTSSSNNSDEVAMGDYYKIEDFQTIIIGESTQQDVYEIAPTKSVQVTSYGGFCEYPMQDGGYIRIKFYGKDLIVWAIETINKPEEWDTSVFATENIARITFYAYYGQGKGSDVPAEHMAEITTWLGSFTIGEEAPDILPPGTNTHYVEIEYLDGTIRKESLDVITIDEIRYKINSSNPPECFTEILSNVTLE